jgi:hypothetical protein
MAEVIRNPRRVHRAPARCEARGLLPGGGFWATETVDVGPHGCQVGAPGPFAEGDPVELTLRNERLHRPLRVTGKVAWASRRAPWRIGVSFDEACRAAAEGWFDELLRAYPGLGVYQHAPETLELAAGLRPGPVPRVPVELTRQEAAIIDTVGDGLTVQAIRDRLSGDWPAVEGHLFAMLGKRLLTLDAAAAGTAAAWRPIIDRAMER